MFLYFQMYVFFCCLCNPTTVVGIYSEFFLIMIQKLITLNKITSSIIIMMYNNILIMHYGWQNYISVLLFMYYPKTMQGFLDKVKNYDKQKRLNFFHCLRSTCENVLSSQIKSQQKLKLEGYYYSKSCVLNTRSSITFTKYYCCFIINLNIKQNLLVPKVYNNC